MADENAILSDAPRLKSDISELRLEKKRVMDAKRIHVKQLADIKEELERIEKEKRAEYPVKESHDDLRVMRELLHEVLQDVTSMIRVVIPTVQGQAPDIVEIEEEEEPEEEFQEAPQEKSGLDLNKIVGNAAATLIEKKLEGSTTENEE